MTESPSKAVVLTGLADRTTKYTKQWSKRYFTFDPSSRKLTYGKDDKSGPKGAICVTKIMRLSEQFEFKASSPDLLSICVDGTLDDGKTDQWSMRFPDLDMFSVWYEAIRGAVSASGLMESVTFGLPQIDPRYNLPFATVPLESLHKFGLLEKAIIYFFGHCGCFTPAGSGVAAVVGTSLLSGGSAQSDAFLVIGDKHVYTFRPSADVIRCFLLSSITKIHHTPGTNFMAIQLEPPEADVIIRNTPKTKEITDILRRLCKVNSQGKEPPLVAITATSVEAFVEAGSSFLRLTPDADFKPNIASPTPKSRLKFALDMYEKKNGSKFGNAAAGGAGEGGSAGGGKLSGVTSLSSSPSGDGVRAGRKEASPPGPPPPTASTLQSLGGKEADMNIPLVRLLHQLQLSQYTVCLLSQHVDLDVLQCMDESDLESFGVRNSAHRRLIMEAAAGGGSSRLSSADSVVLEPSPPGAGATTSVASPTKKQDIVLSDDDDDLVVLPKAPLILLDDSDDDLLPTAGPGSPSASAPPAPKPTINLDDDDDI
jgi:hypothetical protein